jgi:uncharacterized circularly permuted ATP-grasp superfamily protein
VIRATSIIFILGTPVIAITLLLMMVERAFHLGIFDPALGGDPIVGPGLSATQRESLAACIEATPRQWVGQELPQFSSVPSDYYPGGLSSASVGMRLFTVSQRSGYAPMIGGLVTSFALELLVYPAVYALWKERSLARIAD